jgi:hypothetical protein
LLRKQLTGRGKQALSVERRVFAEWCLCHDPSLTQADRKYPFLCYSRCKRIEKIRLRRR